MAESKALPGSGGLSVTVVTPTGPVTSEKSAELIAPGELGEFELLPGHIPFLSKLQAGVLRVGENTDRIYAVGPGFLEVSGQGVVEVLVERAVHAREIDTSASTAELNEVETAIKDWHGKQDAAFNTLLARRAWARAQLSARKVLSAN